MENKKKAIIQCINQIKSIRQQEEKQLDLILSIVNSPVTEANEDEFPKILELPLAICQGCKHWKNSVCDIINYGCHYEIKL